METWLIILLCTVFALIVIGTDIHFKLVWLPKMRENQRFSHVALRANAEGSVPKDGREGPANRNSVRLGIRMGPYELSEFVYSILKLVF
jgi:hypothetical protein